MRSKIRLARVQDAQAIAQVHCKAWQTGYRNIIADDVLDNLSVKTRVETWSDWINKNERLILVAEVKGKVVGFTGYGPCRDKEYDPSKIWEIYSIYILPTEWHRSHGRTLWQEVRNRAKTESIHELYLWVFKENESSRRFYENCGMTLDEKSSKLFEREGIAAPEVRYTIKLL